MDRVFNFAAGPSMLPLPVLEQAQRGILNYADTGMSVAEMSHRSGTYRKIFDHAEAGLRSLMNIPDDYAVLFLQGGATLQFTMTAENLAARGQKAAYAVTGVFAEKACAEASRWCDAYRVTDSCGLGTVPAIEPALLRPGTAYLHITGNNTTQGTMYTQTPAHGEVPLIADWSSGILSSDIPVREYGLIYAGAQKNIGPAGVTAVIVKRSLLPAEIDPLVPPIMSYRRLDETGSMLNTPPTFGIYMCGLVFDWIAEQGGVAEMARRARVRSGLLYDAVDSHPIYTGLAEKNCRSVTNVTFRLPDEETTKRFLAGAQARGMTGLKGYRTVGGVRASVYNAMPMEGAEKLAGYMNEFARTA